MTNEELWRLWKQGDIEFDELFNALRDDVERLAYKYYHSYMHMIKYELEDWVSVGYGSMYQSCLKYKDGKGCKLRTYVYSFCIMEYNRLIKVQTYKKRDISKVHLLSLDKVYKDNSENDMGNLHNFFYCESAIKMFDEVLINDFCSYFSRGSELVESYLKAKLNGETKSDFIKNRKETKYALDKELEKCKKAYEIRRDRCENSI